MKIIALALVLLVSSCSVYKPMPAEEMVIQKQIETPGAAEDQIFEKSKVWITRHLNSHGKIIRYADKANGIIIANGYIEYPAQGKVEVIDKIQYTISFTMKEEIRNSVIALSFGDLLLDIPKVYPHSRMFPMEPQSGGYSVPIQKREDFEAAKRGLLKIATRLGDCLKENLCE